MLVPFPDFRIARCILGLFWLLVACLAFELNGWLQVGMASGMMSVKIKVSFRLALHLRREVNHDAVSLIHLVEGIVLASLKRLVLRVGLSIRGATSKRNATWLILPVVICLSQRLSHACVIKKLVVGLWVGSAGPPYGVHRFTRPFCRRCAPGLNWLGRASGAVTLKKLECSKQAYALTKVGGSKTIRYRPSLNHRPVLRVGLSIRGATSKRNATWLILPVVICLSQRLSHACVIKKLVVGLWVGSAGPPYGVHRFTRPFCRRCAPGLNWLGRASGAVTLKKLECSKQAYALRTTAKAFAKDVFINQERKLGARRRSDTVLVSTINDADQGSADVAYRTPLAPYEKSKFLGSGGSMVARLKLKGIDGRAPPGVEPAA
ncbi:hypothetical protein Tco_0247068 [Tanacetum coccineum]